MKLSMRDSRGRESKTLFFVAIGWAALVFKFILAGMTFKYPPIDFTFAPMSAGEFGAAFAMIIGIWLGHEWQEKAKQAAHE